METETNEAPAEETVEEVDTTPTDDPSELKARIDKLEKGAIAARERNRLLRQQIKDTKPSDTKVEEKKTEDNPLVQKSYLRAAGITHPDDVELALSTAKKWGMEVDKLVDDEDFKVRLERQQTTRSNEMATSDVKSGQGTQQAKATPEYWIAKGTPPTAADIPDRKARASIARAMIANTKSGKTFYND